MLEVGMNTLQINPVGNHEEGEKNFKLIVNYLPQSMCQKDIHSLFSSVGELESCNLIRNKVTGQSLEYCFVTYYRAEDAEKAIDKLNGLRLQNKIIKVALARPRSDDIKESNLYIHGLPKNMVEQDLENLFSPYGRIITSRIICDNVVCQSSPTTAGKNVPSPSKGVGFVRFYLRSEAERAIQELNGTVPKGFMEPITVKFAKNHIKRNAATFRAQAKFLTSSGVLAAKQFEDPIRHPIGRFSSSQLAATSSGNPTQYTILPGNKSLSDNTMLQSNPTQRGDLELLGNKTLPINQMFPGHSMLLVNPMLPGNLTQPANPELPGIKTFLPGNPLLLSNATQPGNLELPGNRTLPNNQMLPGNSTLPVNPMLPGNLTQPANPELSGNKTFLPGNPLLLSNPTQPGNLELPGNKTLPNNQMLPGNSTLLVNPMLPGNLTQPANPELSGNKTFFPVNQMLSSNSTLLDNPPLPFNPALGGIPMQLGHLMLPANPAFPGSPTLPGIPPKLGNLMLPTNPTLPRNLMLPGNLTFPGNSTPPDNPTNSHGWCIFVYNLGPAADENLLWQLFRPFGAVQSVKVIRDSQTNWCRGFGFVQMTNYVEAEVAIWSLNGYTLDNHVLQVSFKADKNKM